MCCREVKANPASTEYVQNAINALRNELNGQINSNLQPLQNQINQMPALINNAVQPLQIQLNQLPTIINNQINNGLEPLQNQVNELPIITHQIGDIVHGGIVFFCR
ncbi:hypothetical protein [Legionella fairfieldensis]|uniref:hypothetical protein n=1 Tax=Legionella fairfieldensis TaxID=45064 RepID=UPI000AE1D4EC|nr:hypothetical protein [Legionella fairfieldensis]